MSVQEKLNTVKTSLSDIKTAIIGKGVTPKGNITTYADAINNIQTGSGGSSSGSSNGKYLVRVIDWDGTILKQDRLNEGDTFTLPEEPTQERLLFQEWSSPVEIIDSAITVPNQDVTIGSIYTTKSGLLEAKVSITKATGLTLNFDVSGTKNWGDGTSDTATSHTYADYGDYFVTCEGVTSIGISAFSHSYSLTSISIPNSVVSIGNNAFNYCHSLTSISIPGGITNIGSSAFNYCFSLRSISIPQGVTSIGNSAFKNCYSLTSISITDGLTSIDSYAFHSSCSLSSISIPQGVTSLGSSAFGICRSLASILIPDEVTSIGIGTFSTCCSLKEYDFSNHTSVPTLSDVNAFGGINETSKIKVPAALEEEWKAATNWVTYADYIVGV